LVLTDVGGRNGNIGVAEIKVALRVEKGVEVKFRRGGPVIHNQLGFPMPKMEILVFDGSNPQWWVRRCERMFEWYNIPRE